MTTSKEPSPDLVRQVIDREEIPLRSRTYDPATVQAVLRYGAIVGTEIEQHEHLARGMDRARQLINKTEEVGRSFPSGMVILAATMADSKGRFQRSWDAPMGGLWLTLILVNTLLPESSRLYPMAAGVACCELLRDYNIPAHIKWVNDVLTDGRKIAGVLTETTVGPQSGEEYILIGIGINVNNDIFPTEITDTAISMKQCLNEKTDLTVLTARMLAKLCWNIGLLHFDEAQGLAQNDISEPTHPKLLLTSYGHLTDIFNRRVLFGFDVQQDPQYEATILGLDETGGLILKLDDGATVVEHSGELIYLD